jgi:hypothetical protein
MQGNNVTILWVIESVLVIGHINVNVLIHIRFENIH